MFIYTTNVLAGPLVLAAWAIDLYLALVGLRFLLARCAGGRAQTACQGLKVITDPLPAAIGRWLVSRNRGPRRAWLPWLVVIAAAVFLHHLLLWLTMTWLR